MKTVFRFDRGTLRKPERTPQGYLKVEGHIGRAGIYEYFNTEEDEKDGFGPVGSKRLELRPDSEVFSPKALNGLDGMAITIGHPRDPKGNSIPVTSENVKQFEIGTVMGGARPDGDRVAAILLIKDKKAIKAVESGQQELSPGYAADIEKKSGVDPKYGRYDAVQMNITYNHVGVVDHARGGSTLRLRMDEAQHVIRADEQARLTSAVDGHQHLVSFFGFDGQAISGGGSSWAMSEGADAPHEHAWIRGLDGTITIGESAGHTHALLDENRYAAQRSDGEIDRLRAVAEGSLNMANENEPKDTASQLRLQTVRADEQEKIASERKLRVDELQVLVDKSKGDLLTSKERIDELQKQIAAGAEAVETEAVRVQKERADEAEIALAKLKDSRDGEIRERCEIIVRAQALLGPSFRTDSLTNDAICEAGIRAMRPKEDLKDKGAAYLRNRFDSLCEDRMRFDASQSRASAVLAQTATIEAPTSNSTSTPAGRAKAWREQWRTPYQPPTARKGA